MVRSLNQYTLMGPDTSSFAVSRMEFVEFGTGSSSKSGSIYVRACVCVCGSCNKNVVVAVATRLRIRISRCPLSLPDDPGRPGILIDVLWKPRAETILQSEAAMSTHWLRCRGCMRQIRDMKLCCCYGLWRHLDTELLNVNLVHLVGTEKEVQWIVGRQRIAN